MRLVMIRDILKENPMADETLTMLVAKFAAKRFACSTESTTSRRALPPRLE